MNSFYATVFAALAGAVLLEWPVKNASLQVQAESAISPASSTDEGLVVRVAGTSFKLKPVEGGTFIMGDRNGAWDEKYEHKVELDGFMMMEYEVTWELWEAIMGPMSTKPVVKYDNGIMKTPVKRIPNHPVAMVSWNDTQEFIKKLNALTGKKFRLPTEAEWEFASNGGNATKGYRYSGSDNLDSVAWYAGNSGKSAHPVGTKMPNELGIYDLTGNVVEWCNDWSDVHIKEYYYQMSELKNPQGMESGKQKSVRGAGWEDDVSTSDPTIRNEHYPEQFKYDLGFRLVISMSDL